MPTAHSHPASRVEQIRERLDAYRLGKPGADDDLADHAADDLEHLLGALDDLAMVARVALAVGDARRAVARGRHGDAARIIRAAVERGGGLPVVLPVVVGIAAAGGLLT
jgi:hypothetical protein